MLFLEMTYAQLNKNNQWTEKLITIYGKGNYKGISNVVAQITLNEKNLDTYRGETQKGSITYDDFQNNHNVLANIKSFKENFEKDEDSLEVLLREKIKKVVKISTTNFDNFCEEVGNKVLSDKEKIKMDIKTKVSVAIENNKQVIFTGAPGTGKTFSVREYVKGHCDDNKQYKFVQFHPSYDYSDFVEGLRPVVIKNQTEATFVRMDGVFKAFCRNAVNDPTHTYYFIVDEINRADLAKVFGELMFGLEESYRGADNRFDTQYKNLVTYRIYEESDCKSEKDKDEIGKAVPIEKDVFKEGFYIPDNLYFIGTMNDIDRSVDSMDFALRRRFHWIDIKANDIMENSLHEMLDDENKDSNGEEYIDIDRFAQNIIDMNKIISGESKFGLSEAYHIGPAYFKKINLENYKEDLKNIFENNIKSILREYTRGRDPKKVNDWVEECRKKLLGDQL